MAVSTGDICADAMDAIQENTVARQHTNLSLENVCFIFKKKYELATDAGLTALRTDFQDIADWFEEQTWIADNDMIFHIKWEYQSMHIATESAPNP